MFLRCLWQRQFFFFRLVADQKPFAAHLPVGVHVMVNKQNSSQWKDFP
jgi:hypothetical protein